MPSFSFGGGGTSNNGASYTGATWVRTYAGTGSGNLNLAGAAVVSYDSISINGSYSNCYPLYSGGYAYLWSNGGTMYFSRYNGNGGTVEDSTGYVWSNGSLQGTVTYSTVPAKIGTPAVSASATLSGTISLSWTAPDSGGATITNYRIFYETSTNNSTWSAKTEITKSNSTTTSYTATGLTVGTYHRFYVCAVNARGTATYSTVSGSIQAPGNPGAPTNLSATISTTAVGSSILGWTAPAVVSSGITGYNVYAQLSGGTRTKIATLTGTGTSYTATGLVQRGVYLFDITARSAFSDANSTESAPSTTSSTQASGVASPPLNLVVTTGGLENQLVLNWFAPSDTAGSSITGYYVYQSTGALIRTINSSSIRTATITGLVPGQSYGWYVRAKTTLSDTLGTYGEASATVYAVPLGQPDAPTMVSLTALPTVSGSAKLTWIPSPAAVYFNIYRTYPDGSFADALVASVSGTSYIFYGLNPNTTYYYKMSAVSSTSEGLKTTQSLSITPLSTSTQPLTTTSAVTDITNSTVFNGTYLISNILDPQKFTYTKTASDVSSTTIPGSFGVLNNRTSDDLSGTFTISTSSPTSNQFTYTRTPTYGTQEISTTPVSVSVVNNTNARFNGVYTAQSDVGIITYSVTGANVSSRVAAGTVVNQSNSTYNGVFTITGATETTFTYPAAASGPDQETTASAGAVDNLTNRTIYNIDETLVTSVPAYNKVIYEAKPSFVNRSYVFDTTTTDSNPGDGKIKFNNGTLGSVTSIYINNKDSSLASQIAWYQMWDDGLSLTNKGKLIVANSSGLWSFTVSGSIVSATGYYKIPVSSPVGTSIPAAGAVSVAFVPYGFTDAPYKFSTSTTIGDPGSGYIRYNASSQIGDVTRLIIDRYSSETSPVDRFSWIDNWYDATSSPTGRIFIRSYNSMAEFALTGDAAYVSGGTYFNVPVSWVSGNAGIMTANFPLWITYVPSKTVDIAQPYGNVRRANSTANLEILYRSGWLG